MSTFQQKQQLSKILKEFIRKKMKAGINNMQKKIGMVIVNYNDYEMTGHLLNNIKEYKCLEKIVVVDNNSSDNSYEELKAFTSKKVIVTKNKSRKYCSGLNVGAKTLINELGQCNIIFSNSDIIINSEDDIKSLSSQINSDVVVVGPTIIENKTLNRGWRLSTVNQEILFNIPLLSRYFKQKFLTYPEKKYQAATTIVDVVSGCFFMVDSKFLEEVNFFDEGTFLYYEEQIFAKKVKLSSKKELINNNVRIIHNHSISIDKSVKRVKKHIILKESQRYYPRKYQHANKIQMALLYITDYFYRGILYIRSLIGI